MQCWPHCKVVLGTDFIFNLQKPRTYSLIAKILQAEFFHIARPYHGFCTINQLEALVPPPSLPPLMRSWPNPMFPPVISLAFPHSSIVPINTPGLSEALG